jgi:hypothetical protein
MIPLLWIFLAWVILVGIFGLTSLITLATTLRYGLSCSYTYLAAGAFLTVSVGIIVLVLGYTASIDLSQGFAVFSAL